MACPSTRYKSDVKHIEVGLTDKGDAVTWLRREVVEHEGIAGSELLVVGDEP